MHTSAAAVEWNCSDCTPLQLCPLEGQVLKLSHAAPYKEDCFFQCLPAGSFKQVLKIQDFTFKTPGILSINITNGHPSLLGYSLLQHLISLQTTHCIQMSLTLEVQSSRSSTLAEQEPFLGWFVYIAGREQTILKIYQDIRTLLLYLHLIFMKIPTSGQDLPKTQTDTSRDILLGGPVP